MIDRAYKEVLERGLLPDVQLSAIRGKFSSDPTNETFDN